MQTRNPIGIPMRKKPPGARLVCDCGPTQEYHSDHADGYKYWNHVHCPEVCHICRDTWNHCHVCGRDCPFEIDEPVSAEEVLGKNTGQGLETQAVQEASNEVQRSV